MKVLVTGGAGYIGSHAVLCLMEAGHDVVVVDNLCNSTADSIARVSKLAGRPISLVVGDVRDRTLLKQVFRDHGFDAVMHFAGLKAVGESVKDPAIYFDNNVGGSLALLQTMQEFDVHRIVFSSSATVYGEPKELPLKETSQVGPTTNPYGRSKLMVEEIMSDLARADARWAFAVLRYFNPIGAHASAAIGEFPSGVPNNLLPYLAQVASGKLERLSIFGDDYPTPDGTGVRDYIHVQDLVEGHLLALGKLATEPGIHVWNLGTGRGFSVLEVVKAFENASGRTIPFTICPRRSGDIAASFADPSKAQRELGWKATRDLDVMMRDAWRWETSRMEATPVSRKSGG
jgi:UDP-glucose 4-epimerase